MRKNKGNAEKVLDSNLFDVRQIFWARSIDAVLVPRKEGPNGNENAEKVDLEKLLSEGLDYAVVERPIGELIHLCQ